MSNLIQKIDKYAAIYQENIVEIKPIAEMTLSEVNKFSRYLFDIKQNLLLSWDKCGCEIVDDILFFVLQRLRELECK